MLREITGWLQTQGPATLAELALHFKIEPGAMDGMLQTLERKGRVARVSGPCAACKGCALGKADEIQLFKAVT